MPSSWLSAGAGASQGLEELLTRQRQDEIVRNNMAQHQGTLAETVRSHQAEEGIKQQEFGQREKDRALAATNLETMREAQRQKLQSDEQNQERERMIQGENLRPLNTEVDYPTYQKIKSLGVLPMTAYKVSNGDPLPNGDSGPPLPKINFTGFQPEIDRQQAEKDRVAQQNATNARLDQGQANTVENQRLQREANANQHGIMNAIAQGGLNIRQKELADKEAERKAKEGDVKIGEKGKSDLRSLESAQNLSTLILENIRKQHPDIEDPTAPPDMMENRVNPKYNTVGNKIGNLYDLAKYKAGIYNDQSSPMVQLESLLKPVQSSRYMSGSRNQRMLDLVLEHMPSPGQTLAEQYSRLKTLQSITPALRQAIIDSERPVKVDANGHEVPRGGGGNSSGSSGLPPGVTVTRID